MKTKNLKRMYNDLRLGAIIDCNGCQIYRDYSERDKREYFFWRHYGASANRVTLSDLRWIVKVIAKSKDYSYEILGHI